MKLNDIINEAKKSRFEELNMDASGPSLLAVFKDWNDESIKQMNFLVKKLKKEGNSASVKSVNNIIGSAQQNVDSWKAAIADIGK